MSTWAGPQLQPSAYCKTRPHESAGPAARLFAFSQLLKLIVPEKAGFEEMALALHPTGLRDCVIRNARQRGATMQSLNELALAGGGKEMPLAEFRLTVQQTQDDAPTGVTLLAPEEIRALQIGRAHV